MNLSHSAVPPPRPVPKNLPGFEVELAVARMFGNTELWWRVLAIFHEHHKDWAEKWEASQTDQNYDSERKCVHALRSSAANVGADRLASAAGLLESLLLEKNPSTEQLSACRKLLADSFCEVLQAATEALAQKPSETQA